MRSPGQGGGHVNQRQHHAGVQSVAHQRLGGIHAAAFHEVGQHEAVDPPCQGHDARAKSDGDGDGSQADGDALAGKHGRAFILRNLGEGTAAEQVLDSHVQQGRALGNGGAQQRSRCAQRGPTSAHAPDGHGQGDAYLAHLLDQLRDGRGQHDAVPLHIAAEGAHDAHKQKAGRDGQIAPARLGRPAAVGQHAAAADQKDGGDQPQRRQRRHGYAENALGVARIIARYVMRHHARDGYRNACRGDGQQQVIGGKNLGINADALAANVGRQRDTIEHADHLAD